MEVQKSISVQFEQVAQIDERFAKVKITLMHLGENYNGSIFTKEAVLSALDTLKNTPILGYVEESRLGVKDFRGHEMELVVENGSLKAKYIGQAFGVIPENCNPRFEIKKGDFNNDLEYLVVDGLMWTKFDDAVGILNEHGSVSQSMELDDNYDGHFNDEGFFVFTRFSFYGACLLGQDVLPAMQQASVELSFSANVNVYQEEIAKKLEEYQIAFSKKQFKEVEHMTMEELLAKYSTTVESLAEQGIVVSEFSIDDLEVKLAEAFATDEVEQPETEMEVSDDATEEATDELDVVADEFTEQADSEGEDEPEQDFVEVPEDTAVVVEKFTLNFEMSHDDIRRKMYDQIDTHMATNGVEGWHYIVSVYETHIIAENDYGDKFYMIDYAKEGDAITFGSVSEVYPMFLTATEKGAMELMRSNFEKLEAENQTLKEFQSNVLKGQHEAMAEELFTKFSKLSSEEVADIREQMHEFSLEEIEARLFERLGRKTANFTANTKQSPVTIKIVQHENEKSGYDHLFKKHGFTK